MKKLNLFLFVIILFTSVKLFAQDMSLPPKITSPVLEAMEGTWESDPYQMMGSSMTDEVTQKMVLNSQFLQVNVRSVSISGFVYEAIIMVAPSSDGTVTGWAYDVFGKDAITTYSGTWKDNMIYLYGKSSWGTESRVINVNGNVMLQNVIYKMVDAKGKSMPEQTIAITYNKKM